MMASVPNPRSTAMVDFLSCLRAHMKEGVHMIEEHLQLSTTERSSKTSWKSCEIPVTRPSLDRELLMSVTTPSSNVDDVGHAADIPGKVTDLDDLSPHLNQKNHAVHIQGDDDRAKTVPHVPCDISNSSGDVGFRELLVFGADQDEDMWTPLPVSFGCYEAEPARFESSVATLVREVFDRSDRLEFVDQNKIWFRIDDRLNSPSDRNLWVQENRDTYAHDMKFLNLEGTKHQPAFPGVEVRWRWLAEDDIRRVRKFSRWWFFWKGLTNNTSLKETTYRFATVIKKVQHDADRLDEGHVSGQEIEHVLHDAMGQLRTLDGLVNRLVRHGNHSLRVDQLMQLAGVPYMTFVKFYISARNQAFHEKDDTKRAMELVRCIMESTDYLLTMCNSLEVAVARNDDLPFKVLLVFLNCVTIMGQFLYERYIAPYILNLPEWQVQIEAVYKTVVNATVFNSG